MLKIRNLAISLACVLCAWSAVVAGDKVRQQDANRKPHAVFVIGTPHYEPAKTMPPLARQLAEKFGFRTTVILPDGDPERSEKGIEGLDVLKQADIAVFYLRFLTLPKEQLDHIINYVESGKPVIGLRTSTHAFIYPEGHELQKWNIGFGKDVLGSSYYVHMAGTTDVKVLPAAKDHPVLTGIPDEPLQAAGVLYRACLPADATPLLMGTGKPRKAGTVTNIFGTHVLKDVEKSPIAWVWQNQWGGRVFTTTLGHVKTFENEWMVRLLVNGIHWAAGRPVPKASVKMTPIVAGNDFSLSGRRPLREDHHLGMYTTGEHLRAIRL